MRRIKKMFPAMKLQRIHLFFMLFPKRYMIREKNTIASVAWPLGKLYVLVSIKAFSGRALCASALMSNSNTTAPIIAMLTKKMSWYLFLYARKARRRKERKRSFIGLMISVMKMMNGVRDSVWN